MLTSNQTRKKLSAILALAACVCFNSCDGFRGYDCDCDPAPDKDPNFTEVFTSEVIAIESTSITGFPQHPMRYADPLTNANVQVDAENKKMYLRFSINGEYYKLAYDMGDPKYQRE